MRFHLVALVLCLAGGFAACAPSFFELASKGDLDRIKQRLDAGQDPNEGLGTAAANGQLAVMKLLLDRGARVDGDSTFFSPLDHACMRGQSEAAAMLLDRGADVNRMEELDRFTALHWAADAGKADIVRLLLERGADPMATSKDGRRPRDMAKAGNIIEMLQRAEAEGPEKRALRRARQARRRAVEAALANKRKEIAAAEQAGDAAKTAGRPKDALARYRDALKDAPPGTEPDFRLRGKIIGLALAMNPPPPIPDEVQSFADRGQGIIKRAENQEGLGLAVAELRKATLAAPWWATGYFNLGLALEKTEDYDEAIQSFKLYLAAAPDASDAKAVRRKIDDLIGAKELAEQK